MRVKILGAHQLETKDTRLTSLLVDEIIGIDAGSLTSTLTMAEQEALQTVLITHHHFDHTRDLLTLGLNTDSHTTDVYSTTEVLDSLSCHLVNGALYPNLTESHRSNPPSLRFNSLNPGEVAEVLGYSILPLLVPHGPPTVGYQVTDSEGKAVFYTGDTGAGCSSAWPYIRPDLLFIEATVPNRLEEYAGGTHHLTPRPLTAELEKFRETKGYLPKVLVPHMNPVYEGEIRAELEEVARRLEADLTPAHEGLEIEW